MSSNEDTKTNIQTQREDKVLIDCNFDVNRRDILIKELKDLEEIKEKMDEQLEKEKIEREIKFLEDCLESLKLRKSSKLKIEVQRFLDKEYKKLEKLNNEKTIE